MKPVVLLPSLGRPAGDFDRLVVHLAAHGRQAVPVDLPGVATASDRAVGADLHAVAADVAGRVASLGPSVHVVGHALGNRVARCLAADRPERVASLVLLGCGGKVPGDPDAQSALLRCFTEEPGSATHLAAVSTAFFAPGRSVPPSWVTGWWPEAAAAQGRAARSTPWEEWWVPPEPVPVLAVVGRQDRISPPANAEDLVAAVGERGRMVVVDDAGHALLPEQPDALAEVVTGWLDDVDP